MADSFRLYGEHCETSTKSPCSRSCFNRELDHDSGVQPMLARKELSALKEGELLNSRSVVVFGESLNREITWDVIC